MQRSGGNEMSDPPCWSRSLAATVKRRRNGLFHPFRRSGRNCFFRQTQRFPKPAQVLFPIEFRGDEDCPPRKLFAPRSTLFQLSGFCEAPTTS